MHHKKGSQLGSPLSIKSWSGSSIVVRIPESHTPGSGSIVIVSSGDELAKSMAPLQVLAGPCSGGSRIGLRPGAPIQGPKQMKSRPAINFAVTPKIHKVEAESGFEIKRGTQLRIEGESFGATKGKAYFRILGYLDLPHELKNVGWVSDTEVLASVPSNLKSDVPVHSKVEIQIESSSRRKSAWFTPRYKISTRTAAQYAVTPKIYSVTGPDGISSGKDFVIEGSGFGKEPGGVTMRMAGSNANYAVDNLVWESSERIRATVFDILGTSGTTKDTEASFRVTNKGGHYSLWFTTPFGVTIHEIVLPGLTRAVQRHVCGVSSVDACVCFGRVDLAPWRLAGHSVYGWHRQGQVNIGNDDGYDEHQIKLHNGWVISKVEAILTRTSHDETLGAMNSSEAGQAFVGKTDAVIPVHWSVSPSDYVMYEYKFWIKGPRGIPYHCDRNSSGCGADITSCSNN